MEAKVMEALYDTDGNLVGLFDEIIRVKSGLKCRKGETWVLYSKDGKELLVKEAQEIQCYENHVVICHERGWFVKDLTSALVAHA